MNTHSCKYLLVHCMDFRLRNFLNDFGDKLEGGYDLVSIAGGVKNVDFLMTQVNISVSLHQMTNVILVNHEDCGAYGEAGTAEKHSEDLKNAAEKIKGQYPDLEVNTYYLHLDGTFEQIS